MSTIRKDSELEREYKKFISSIPDQEIIACMEYERKKHSSLSNSSIILDSGENLFQDIRSFISSLESQLPTEITNIIGPLAINDITATFEGITSITLQNIINNVEIRNISSDMLKYFENVSQEFLDTQINKIELNTNKLKEKIKNIIKNGFHKEQKRKMTSNEENDIESLATAITNELLKEKIIIKLKQSTESKINTEINRYNRETLPSLITTSTNYTKEQIEKYRQKLYEETILKITYLSANASTEIIFPKNYSDASKIVLFNEFPIPFSIFQYVQNNTKKTLKSAMNNIFTFIWNRELTFYSNNIEYRFTMDNIHILGIKKDILNDLDTALITEIISDKDIIINPTSYDYINIKGEFENIHNNIAKLKNAISSPEIPPIIENRIKELNAAQEEITNYLKDPELQKEQLIYLIRQKKENLGLTGIITYERLNQFIDEIFSENGYKFEKSFIDSYRSNPTKIMGITLELIKYPKEKLEEKFKYIESIQEYISYAHRKIAYDIITTKPKDKWSTYFNQPLIIDGETINFSQFGLANVYINYELLKLERFINLLKQNVADGKTININDMMLKHKINIFKIFDKTLYLNHFNYMLDVNGLFVTDLQEKNDANIICELEAFHETLLGFFKNNSQNSNQYKIYSSQNIEEATIKSYSTSSLTDIIDFGTKEERTEFCLVEKKAKDNTEGYSNIITQAHSDFKRKKYSVTEFIDCLKTRKIIMRYATSIKLDETQNPSHTYNNLSLNEKIRLNIISCSNAISWLNEMTQQDFYEFSGIQTTYDQFIEIKTLLYGNVINNLKELNEKKNQTNILEQTNLDSYLLSTINNQTNEYEYNKLSIVNIMKIITTESEENIFRFIKENKEIIETLPNYVREHLYIKLAILYFKKESNNGFIDNDFYKEDYINILNILGKGLYVPTSIPINTQTLIDKAKSVISSTKTDRTIEKNNNLIYENEKKIENIYNAPNEYPEKFMFNIKFVIMPLVQENIKRLEENKEIINIRYLENKKKIDNSSDYLDQYYGSQVQPIKTFNSQFNEYSKIKFEHEYNRYDYIIRKNKEFYQFCEFAISKNSEVLEKDYSPSMITKSLDYVIERIPKKLFDLITSDVEHLNKGYEKDSTDKFLISTKKAIMNRILTEKNSEIYHIIREYQILKEEIEPSHARDSYVPLKILGNYPKGELSIREIAIERIKNNQIKNICETIMKMFPNNLELQNEYFEKFKKLLKEHSIILKKTDSLVESVEVYEESLLEEYKPRRK